MKKELEKSLRWALALIVSLSLATPLLGADAAATTFEVRGMHCVSCEQRIEGVIGRIEGVLRVEASAEDERVVVEHDPAAVDAARLEQEIERLGYEATLEIADESTHERDS